MSLATAYAVAGITSLTVAAIFAYLGLTAQRPLGLAERHYRIWALAFLAQAIRQGLQMLAAQGMALAPLLADAAFIVTVALTVLGTLTLIERGQRWPVVALGAAAAMAWLLAAQRLGLDPYWQAVPMSVVLGGGLAVTGLALIARNRAERGVGYDVLAALFLLWGLNVVAGAVLRESQLFTKVGYFVGFLVNVGVVFFLMITAQRRAELLQHRSEMRLRTLADNLPALVAYMDAERRIRFVNRTGERWYARAADEILGHTIDELLPRAHVEANQADNAQALAGMPLHFERTQPYPDGVTRTVEVFYIPDRGEDGTVRGVFGVINDVSERRATEAQLRQSQKMEAIGQLTGGVAHDFNNLLGVISGNLELLDETLADQPELRAKLQRAARAVDRGATLTSSLLAFARQQPLAPRVLDLARVVREMTDLLRRTVPESIEIELIAAGGLWRCAADMAQLQNALLNLVLNARDAMAEGGKLTIETANARLDDAYAEAHAEVAPGQYVLLAVSDSGVGMPAAVIARAFDPFFTTKRGGSGTGLGLSMVYGFAKQSGGHVKIYSEPGHGTTVKLYLPRSHAAADAGDEDASRAEARGNGETVLVVEDDDEMRRLTCDLLTTLGYAPTATRTGPEALDLLRTMSAVDLLLTDVMLPGGLNGRQLAARAVDERPGLRVLYMSGYTENAIVHHGRLDPGVQLLQKPFRRRDLAVKMRAVLARPVEAE
jgi:PAS domain S-box-containing protein